MSTAKQPSDLTKGYHPAPKGKGKRSSQNAVRMAQKTGSATHEGKTMSLKELGGTPGLPMLESSNRETVKVRYQQSRCQKN